MNTINPVRPYMTLRNEPQTPTTQPEQQTPAFKGQLGQKVVQDIAAKKVVTVASILALVGGILGLSKDKVSDVIEELVDKIKSLMGQNENLTQQNLELKKTLINTKSERDVIEAEKERMQADITQASVANKLENQKLTAKIAELEKYEAMAKVKSVDELDIVTPEQFVELLNEAKENQGVAEESLLNYLFKGNGQEEFLAQMERSNKILKAKGDGILNLEDMNRAYENIGIIIGYDSAYVAQQMMKKALKDNEAGAQLSYPPVRVQVETNADAIINPMKNPNFKETSNKEVLENVSKFYTELAVNTNKFEMNTRSKFEARNLDRNHKPYYTFTKEDGSKIDIYLDHLANGCFGISRTTTADGTVIDLSGCYTNL